MSEPMPQLLRGAAAAQSAGRTLAACLLVTARGSTPQRAGALMFVDDTGWILGTIGGGCIEAEVRRRAMMLLHERGSALLRFRLDHDYGWDDGLICGGTVELAIAPAPPGAQLEDTAAIIERGQPASLSIEVQVEPDSRERFILHIPPRKRLYIAGAGHIGCAVARHALALDFDVTLLDDRPDLLCPLKDSVRIICGPIAEELAHVPVDPDAFFVVVTRGHRHDQQALAAILQSAARAKATAGYIGMIGSRRKVKVIFEDMMAGGTPHEQLASVHAPIGLPIGAQSVAEIAISIAAQLVQVRAVDRSRFCTVERQSLAGHTRPPIGILLAAGQGRRMGCTKQVLPLPGDPQGRALAAAAFDAIAPCCSKVVVVVSHDADAVLAALSTRPHRAVLAAPGADMSESVRAGLESAGQIDPGAPVLLHLADHPFVPADILTAILRAAAARPECAIRPTCGGRGGHPVLIPPALIASILLDPLDAGLRGWWKSHPDTILDLPLDDPQTLTDVDTPADYHSLSR
jgi:xanthine dehydrogenase accessory factor